MCFILKEQKCGESQLASCTMKMETQKLESCHSRVVKFQTTRRRSENEKEFEILRPELREFITIKKHSRKYKQFQNFE
jgi:hypothetical protein